MNERPDSEKPRLLYLQWDHRPNAGQSNFLLQQVSEHVRCLQENFDVTVINRDCSYDEVCDRYRPDLVLFESGYQTFVSRRPRITDLSTHTEIPRVAFYNADAWADTRAGFLSDMNEFGVETFFGVCTTTLEYFTDIPGQFYIWPNFIDPEVFHDYGATKSIPVLLSGKAHEQYPWRQAVFPLVSELFPSLTLPQFHHGSGLANRTLIGRDYARTLSASKVSLTCGTMAKEVVRKHFEIPGSGACLVAEEAEALRQAGFVHMENCVFASRADIVDVLDHLFANPDELARITARGHELVHARHTLRHRPQIYQWFKLQSSLASGEAIVQRGPFENLVVERRAPARTLPTFASGSLDRAALATADAAVSRGDIQAARASFEHCLGFVRYLPEARFGLALCDLADGKPAAAERRLTDLVEGTTERYGAAVPDPVEWAYLLVAILCRGEVSRAARLARNFDRLDHSELNHTRRAIALLSNAPMDASAGARETGAPRASVHGLPTRSFGAFRDWLAATVVAAGQADLATRLNAATPVVRPGRPARLVFGDALRDRFYAATATLLRRAGLSALAPNVPATAEFGYMKHVRARAKRLVRESAIGGALVRTRRDFRRRSEMKALRQGLRPRRS